MSEALDAGRVLRDLHELWRAIGEEGQSGVLRACAMTLMVAAEEEDDPQELGETLAGLVREHPSRAVVLRRTSAAEPSARATVDCWKPFGRAQQICSEKILIESPRGRIEEVMPLVRGVTVADLPVVVWFRCLGQALEPEMMPLARMADRILIDTTGLTESREAIGIVDRLRSLGRATGDLSWTRITRWRETIHSIFSASGFAGKLDAVETIEIEWAGEGFPAPVCYFASWLQKAMPEARLTLRCIERKMPPEGDGRMRTVRLSGPGVELRLRRPEGVDVAIEIEELATRVLFPRLDAEALLREELSVLGRDAEFESTLDIARGLAAREAA